VQLDPLVQQVQQDPKVLKEFKVLKAMSVQQVRLVLKVMLAQQVRLVLKVKLVRLVQPAQLVQ
jgi:hypothetical protein